LSAPLAATWGRGPGIATARGYNNRMAEPLPESPILRALSIRDFTIIAAIELEFSTGFGAITGETGAGKSILVDALQLLLGDRADASMVADGAARADLSASFEIGRNHPARTWLEENALSDDELLVLRRMVPADGASRAWVNGQPVAIGQLRSLGALLVEIHGQHEHQRLVDPSHQRAWLDRHVESDQLDAVAQAAGAWREQKNRLNALRDETGDAVELERIDFQLARIERLGLRPGEFQALDVEQRRLGAVDALQNAYSEALEALDGEDRGAASRCHHARRALEAIADHEPEAGEIIEMINTAQVNLDEAGSALLRLNDGLESDPTRLEEIEQRMARATALAREHLIEPDQLPALEEQLRQRRERVRHGDELRAQAESQLEALEQAWRKQANALSTARRKAGVDLAARIIAALAELGMDQATIQFEVTPDPDAPVSVHGADQVEMLFSANPGQRPKPMRKIASGGELSRLSLAMIIAGAEPDTGQVRVFDEIDAGVGGEIANAVGEFLHRAGQAGPALCVTHLAQVAARADNQIRVAKASSAGATRVVAATLDSDQRVVELARMLGDSGSETGLQHARRLLAAAER